MLAVNYKNKLTPIMKTAHKFETKYFDDGYGWKAYSEFEYYDYLLRYDIIGYEIVRKDDHVEIELTLANNHLQTWQCPVEAEPGMNDLDILRIFINSFDDPETIFVNNSCMFEDRESLVQLLAYKLLDPDANKHDIHQMFNVLVNG